MEKAKSLLIYFSNRYLNKSLDDTINDHFSDIFEIYDDIKHLGEELGINLIKNRDFNEDNFMRYHFVTYSNENYDPTASYVLQFSKKQLTKFRSETSNIDYPEIHKFISDYISSMKSFFINCKIVIERARTEAKFFKIFVILNLSATLYPLIIKLQGLGLLDKKLTGNGREHFNFYDLVELIEVRVYKTRATDPKADIARLVFGIDNKKADDIENWLIWFNSRWMPKEEFQSNLSRGIYGNRALNHIFITYCEHINKNKYSITELNNLINKFPNIEHILSQTHAFDPVSLGFDSKEDFIDFEHTIGNLTIFNKSINSSVQNKNAIDKIEGYGKSVFTMTKMLSSEIDTDKEFDKNSVQKRTQILADYCMKRWWSDRSVESPMTEITANEEVEVEIY
ncbi:hypothetical protein D3C72_949300 [compost metagenome]